MIILFQFLVYVDFDPNSFGIVERYSMNTTAFSENGFKNNIIRGKSSLILKYCDFQNTLGWVVQERPDDLFLQARGYYSDVKCLPADKNYGNIANFHVSSFMASLWIVFKVFGF